MQVEGFGEVKLPLRDEQAARLLALGKWTTPYEASALTSTYCELSPDVCGLDAPV